MSRTEMGHWARTWVIALAIILLAIPINALTQEVAILNQRLGKVEREVQYNTAAQERLEALARGTLKSFGNGIE